MKKQMDYQGLTGAENPLLKFPQVYEAAVDAFSQKPYEEASLNDILKAAGISKGSFYHHFGDKFGLYLAMMDRVIQKKIGFFTPLLQRLQDTGDFFGTLRLVIRGTVEFMLEDKRLHHLFNQNMEAPEALKQRLLSYFQYDYNQGFGPLIRAAIASGQIDPRYSEGFIEKILEILFSNTHRFYQSKDSTASVVDSIEQMVDMMQFGLEKKE